MEKYRRVKVIGKGSFGYVVLVLNTENNRLYVMKVIDAARMDYAQKEEAINEVLILKAMRHPYIVTYRESFIQKRCLCIVMDYADGGDMYRNIAKQKALGEGFSENVVLDWFVQICLAINHIHNKNILHRDLKTQNVFMTAKGDIKIGDFGISRILKSSYECVDTTIGTPYYLSPEICQEKPYNQKSDIWSLGCILYEITTLKHAFDSNNMKGLMLKILKGHYAPIPSYYSPELSELIAELLNADPQMRPSVKKILKKEFLRSRIAGVLTQTVVKYKPMRTRPRTEEILTPEGISVPGISNLDSVYSKIEALKIYLENELGDTFLEVYEHLSQGRDHVTLDLDSQQIQYIPLISQLLRYEESYYN